MIIRNVRSHIEPASLLLGLCLMTLSCGASTPATGTISPTLTPSPSPAAMVSPTATATAVSNTVCGPNAVPPPGPLPTTIPLPPGTLVNKHSMGIMAGSVEYPLCTPATTQAAIMAFMESAMPAAGWATTGEKGCTGAPYQWFKGKYGVRIITPITLPVWYLDICPHIGE